MNGVLKLMSKYKAPIAIMGVLGSIAGLVISLFDLDNALKGKKK